MLKNRAFANLPALIRDNEKLRAEAEAVRAENARQAEMRRAADAKAAAELAAERAAVERKAAEAQAKAQAEREANAGECKSLVMRFLADLAECEVFGAERERTNTREKRDMLTQFVADMTETAAYGDAIAAKAERQANRANSRKRRRTQKTRTRANIEARKAGWARAITEECGPDGYGSGWTADPNMGVRTTKNIAFWTYDPAHLPTFTNIVERLPNGQYQRVSLVKFSQDTMRIDARTGQPYRFRRLADTESFKRAAIEVRWTGVPNSQASGGYVRKGKITPDGIERNGVCFPHDNSEPEAVDTDRVLVGPWRNGHIQVMRSNRKMRKAA